MRTTHDARPSADAPADAAAGIPAAPGLPPNARVAPKAGPDQDCPAARRPGRPRSEQAEQAILEAAIEAVADRGIDGVSCEDVAARAGVGKATLYRRWPGKEDLLIAAFAALKRPLPEPRGESVRDDLIAMLEVMAEDAEDPRFAQQYALLHAEGERYPRLVALYKERVVEPRRELMRSVLRRGIADGDVRPDADVEIAMLALTGAVMIRGKHDTLPAEPCFAARVVDELLLGLAPR
jgi:AcrR family transcriptional regulator